MKKLSIILSATLIVCAAWVLGLAMPVLVNAQTTIIDGDAVSPDTSFQDADGSIYYPYDVFIIKIIGAKKFKRLVLNPRVFESYGHLKWENIKKVPAVTLRAYTTSSLVRSIDDGSVYNLAPSGDTGQKRWVENGDCFNNYGFDWDAVYIINSTDRDNYITSSTLCGAGDWQEGDSTVSLARAHLGSRAAPAGITRAGSCCSNYEEGEKIYALTLYFKVDSGNSGSCIPLNIRRQISVQGDLAVPNTKQFKFPGTGGCSTKPNLTYYDQEVIFVVTEQDKALNFAVGDYYSFSINVDYYGSLSLTE